MPTKPRIDLGKNQCPTKKKNATRSAKNLLLFGEKAAGRSTCHLSDRATDGGETPPPRTPAVGSHNT